MSLRWPNGQNYVAPTSQIYVGPTVPSTLGQRCANVVVLSGWDTTLSVKTLQNQQAEVCYCIYTNHFVTLCLICAPTHLKNLLYPFDGHNVLKRTKVSTSEKPTILHGGTSDTFKTGTKIRCLNSHSDISVYLGECSHLQPL